MRLLPRIVRGNHCGRLDVIDCIAASAHESDRAACGACDVRRALGLAEVQLTLKSMADASSLRLQKPCATAPVVQWVIRSSVRDNDESFVADVVDCVRDIAVARLSGR
jgi:hypothetical protein